MGQKVFQEFTHDLNVNMIGDIEGHRCDPYFNSNFDDMWYEDVAQENHKKYGCSVPWHHRYQSKDNKRIEICDNTDKGILATKNFIDSKDSPLSKDLVPCARYDVNLGLPVIDSDDNPSNEAYVKLYLKTEIRIKKVVIYYDSTTFAAEVGGYVGMFLGVSLVDLAILLRVLSIYFAI